MKRRTLLAGGAAALASPALAQPALARPARVLRSVPYVDLPVLDPIASTAAQVRNHAFPVLDTLHGLDAADAPRPQMLAGHTMDDGGRLWTLLLRDGLRFHDGAPVLARDAVASIRRWAAVDGFGAALMAATDALDAPDGRAIRFRLGRPFPLLPDASGKMPPSICAIMPGRLAMLPPGATAMGWTAADGAASPRPSQGSTC